MRISCASPLTLALSPPLTLPTLRRIFVSGPTRLTARVVCTVEYGPSPSPSLSPSLGFSFGFAFCFRPFAFAVCWLLPVAGCLLI
jgi:hypothetical protein